MAFGDALRPTDGATVVLNVDVSQTAKLEQAEAQWRESVGTMSREALKLDLAQERLKKSLSAYGAESAQAKRATIALRDAEEQAARTADKLTRETDQLSRARDRERRSTASLVRTAASYASIFLGGYGLIGLSRLALNASSNLAEQQDFANRIFKASTSIVQNYANNALGLARDQAFEAASGIGALLSKFTDSDAKAARLSVTLTKLGVDLASIKNTGVDEALVALRSGIVGESEPLRRYAVLLSAAAVEQEALAMTGKKAKAELDEGEKVLARVNIILREAAYAQGNYADTIDSTANKEREAQKNLRNTAILIGDTLQPAYRELLGRVNAYLGSAEHQKEIQERVNNAVKTGEKAVRGFAGALEIAEGLARPLVDALGGVENTVKAITLLWIAFKAKAVLGFAGTAAASALTSRKMIADALAAGSAWDFATRSRTMFVGTSGPGGFPTTGGTGRGRSSVRDRINQYGNRPTPRATPGFGTATIAAVIAAALFPSLAGQGGETGGGSVTRVDDFEGLLRLARSGRLTVDTIDTLEERGLITPAQATRLRRAIPGAEAPRRSRGGSPRRGASAQSARRSERDGDRPTESDLLLAVARPGNEVGDLQRLRAFYARQIRVLEARKNLTEKQKEALRALYGEIAGVQSQLDAITDAEEQKAADQRAAAAAKREAAREREAKRMDRIQEAAARASDRRADLLRGTGGNRVNMRNRALRNVDAVTKALRDRQAEQNVSQNEVRRELLLLISGLNSLREFGSNFQSDPSMAQVATQSYAQTQELREQSRTLGLLVRGQWHPGAWYAGNELAVAGTGVGF
jgi:hypothetical protein